jgi:hypothetical protein
LKRSCVRERTWSVGKFFQSFFHFRVSSEEREREGEGE